MTSYKLAPTIKGKIYRPDIIAGALMIPESRKIAQLMLENVDKNGWHKAIVVDNILQKKSIKLANRQARLICNRLSLMSSALWDMIANGTLEMTTQALLAASVKHSRLIGDFLLFGIKANFKIFNNKVSFKDWEKFLVDCDSLDPQVGQWAESTRKKLGEIVFHTLVEAHYLESTRTKIITPVILITDLRQYLVNNNENYILNCMDLFL